MSNLTNRKTTIRIYAVIAVMILLVGGICCGCNFAASKDSPVITLYDATEMSNGKEFNEAVNALYKICTEEPEVLVSTMSAFPRRLRELGIILDDPDMAPMVIKELLESEDGGIIQRALLGMLKSILEEADTQFAFGEWSGKVRMLYMGEHDPSGPQTTANMYLYWDTTELKDAKIFGMVIGDQPEVYEFAYFYMEGGFQRFVPVVETE